MSEDKALRYNEGKLQWSLVDFKSLEPMVQVLEFGAKKYAPNNWKKGLETQKIMESLLRHAFAFMSGEDNDPENGISHVGHMQCNLMFLQYMLREKPELDTREKQPFIGKGIVHEIRKQTPSQYIKFRGELLSPGKNGEYSYFLRGKFNRTVCRTIEFYIKADEDLAEIINPNEWRSIKLTTIL